MEQVTPDESCDELCILCPGEPKPIKTDRCVVKKNVSIYKLFNIMLIINKIEIFLSETAYI